MKKKNNPRLQVKSAEEYAEIMDNLNLKSLMKLIQIFQVTLNLEFRFLINVYLYPFHYNSNIVYDSSSLLYLYYL